MSLIVFWMDDPNDIDIQKDSTYILIHECMARGHKVYYASKNSCFGQNSDFICHAQEFKQTMPGDPLLYQSDYIKLTQADIDVFWIRCDPPVDQHYIMSLQLFLQFNHHICFMNHPQGILSYNEKGSILQFSTIIPNTIISNNKGFIQNFIKTQEKVVLKPMNSFGGQGIFLCQQDDPNIDTITDLLSHNESQFIMVQEALDYTQGDKRIILLNGAPIGAVLRKSNTSYKNNLMAGGYTEKTTITSHDETIIKTIAPFIKSQQLHLVGIDILDGKLTEINVTSPTCIQEINHHQNHHLEREIISYMESLT